MNFQGGRMKEYIWQFYNQGFGSIFYVRPINYIKMKVKNKYIFKILEVFIKMIYTIIFVLLGILVLCYKLK